MQKETKQEEKVVHLKSSVNIKEGNIKHTPSTLEASLQLDRAARIKAKRYRQLERKRLISQLTGWVNQPKISLTMPRLRKQIRSWLPIGQGPHKGAL